jgi:hypothetical protein
VKVQVHSPLIRQVCHLSLQPPRVQCLHQIQVQAHRSPHSLQMCHPINLANRHLNNLVNLRARAPVHPLRCRVRFYYQKLLLPQMTIISHFYVVFHSTSPSRTIFKPEFQSFCVEPT